MGRLNLKKKLSKGLPYLRKWGAPLVAALALFIVIQILLFGSNVPSRGALEDSLKKGDLLVFSEPVGDYQQVYYLYNDIKVYISNGSVNHTNPVSSGRYVTWFEVINGTKQLVLYDLLDKTRLQLTFSGVNFNQEMDGNIVVWERIINGSSQVFLYDGSVTKQVSDKYRSERPEVQGNRVVYAQQVAPDQWQNLVYYRDSGHTQVINKVSKKADAYPHFVGEDIKTRIYEK